VLTVNKQAQVNEPRNNRSVNWLTLIARYDEDPTDINISEAANGD